MKKGVIRGREVSIRFIFRGRRPHRRDRMRVCQCRSFEGRKGDKGPGRYKSRGVMNMILILECSVDSSRPPRGSQRTRKRFSGTGGTRPTNRLQEEGAKRFVYT